VDNIKYKINILSLGRYNDKTGKTHKLLCKMKIKHYLFCEDFEYIEYKNWINGDYCNLINSGKDYHLLEEGGQHIRNYIMDYWRERGENFIWMLDDNIEFYQRLYYGNKIKIYSKEIFTSMEHYIKHYQNIGLCSHNLSSEMNSGGVRKCLYINMKHFSSLLINLKTNIRFRFKYNEDHIFSIDNLVKGFQTICFNHVLYNKKTSGTESGGNATIYKSGGNCEGYNLKCDTTINFIKADSDISFLDNTIDKCLTIKTKIKNNRRIRHLTINYKYIENNNLKLQKIAEITPFYSNLKLE
jgi:hypothetical protein